MNDFRALDLSADGMRAQRLRMQVISENLANQHTTGPNGPYMRKEIVFQSTPLNSFGEQLDAAMAARDAEPASAQTVSVTAVREDGAQPIRVYDPSHPHADAQGYVSMPNISVMREMADMVEASRSYEANLTANKATQDMLASAIDLIKR